MINLLFCGNNRVFDGLITSLLSIMKHTSKQLNIYVLTMDLREYNPSYLPITSKEIDYLKEIVKEKNNSNEVTLIDATSVFIDEMKDSVNMQNFYTPYCLLRLFADLLPLPSKILYLDVDVMATKDISSLYNIDITNYELAAAIDYLGKIFKYPRYINSGVLLLNLDRIKETRLFARTRQSCLTNKMAFPDQDALNKFVKDKLIISSIYNSQRRLKKKTVIRHFCKSIRLLPIFHTINVKPWEIERVHKELKEFSFDDILCSYKEKIDEYRKLEEESI